MLAVIPAREGSKGLPGKNVKLLCGKPLISYTIEAALQANIFDRIIVNTDSKLIADIGLQYGAEVPFLRPSELSTDNASSIDVLIHTVEWFKSRNSIINDIAILQPTSPLRTATHIQGAFSIYESNKADSVISFVKQQHPIFWSKIINNEGKVEDFFTDASSNRQKYRELYLPNGAIYLTKTALLSAKSLYSKNTYAYIMNRNSSVDIDTQEDFEYCEYLINRNA